ncbi:putative membrane protein [Sinobacterium caligoides]|uniref:Putative membrane protein n=1 Tax=Sinobacterium caligoides TaxID=933926 RepID=A0A3N2DDZ6_9GAMM|nr:TIGR01620 family protein [Sinobacterium caligoides]ROR98015.1 putative membrane protein [Sinobacterium caligoides]
MSDNKRYEFDAAEPSDAVEQRSGPEQPYEFNVDEEAVELPQAITDNHRLPRQADYRGLRLEALPIKGLKALSLSAGLLFLAVAGWELSELIRAAASWHWAAALGVAGLLAAVVACTARSLWSLRSNRQTLSDVDQLQAKSEAIHSGSDLAQCQSFVDALQAFYRDKPQAALLQECLDEMPDYYNDREVMGYLEEAFLHPLDREAEQRVAKYCLQTGVAVAASPWASMDMLLALWRSLKMIEDVGQVYGVRPSKLNRLGLLKLVLKQITFVGATEVLIDRALDELSIQSFAGKASGQIGQGMGAAIYCARIGLAAMTVSRPIEWQRVEKPRIRGLLKPLLKQLTRIFSKE